MENSIVLISTESAVYDGGKGKSYLKYSFSGLAADFSKLPKKATYSDMIKGSSYFALDTQQMSFYDLYTDTWSALA